MSIYPRRHPPFPDELLRRHLRSLTPAGAAFWCLAAAVYLGERGWRKGPVYWRGTRWIEPEHDRPGMTGMYAYEGAVMEQLRREGVSFEAFFAEELAGQRKVSTTCVRCDGTLWGTWCQGDWMCGYEDKAGCDARYEVANPGALAVDAERNEEWDRRRLARLEASRIRREAGKVGG